jgi:hypothetical protein
MRFSTASLLLSVLVLQACAPAYENGHLSRFINRQREARDACLRNHVSLQDDRISSPNAVAQAIAATCAPENDRLIQAMSTADPSGEAQITDAVRKDATIRAETYILELRARPGAKTVPLLP